MPGRRRRPFRGRRLRPGTDRLLRAALVEDRWRHDVTSRAVVPPGTRARALVSAQAAGTVSGLALVQRLAGLAGLNARLHARDGARVRPGSVVLELRGDARRILAVERTLLNFVTHLSGVATLTARVVRNAHRVRPGFRVRATRKTLPGLRDLEKAAVVDGGGEPHRRDLSEAVLIKSTHQALVPLARAIRRVRQRHRMGLPVQVEVRSIAQARAAARAGARSLLVDNQAPAQLRRIVRAVRALPGGNGVELEASGGITPENIAAYARTGVDAASVGRLTHSAPAVPFHLTLVPRRNERRRMGHA